MKDLEAHLKGTKTLGSYVIREDGKINFATIDIDDDPDTFNYGAYLNLTNIVFDLFPEFERVLEFSGRRGFHIWLFPKAPESPAFLRELIKTRLRSKGLMNIEIYPKQDNVDETEKQLGNLIKLPCGIHIKSGKRSEILRWEHVKN